jgi:hypothetical protein
MNRATQFHFSLDINHLAAAEADARRDAAGLSEGGLS